MRIIRNHGGAATYMDAPGNQEQFALFCDQVGCKLIFGLACGIFQFA
jgi:hypothetical protein